MRNDLTIYDKVADRWWSDDIRWVRTLKNLVPGRLAWFDRQIDWQGKVCAGSGLRRRLHGRGAGAARRACHRHRPRCRGDRRRPRHARAGGMRHRL